MLLLEGQTRPRMESPDLGIPSWAHLPDTVYMNTILLDTERRAARMLEAGRVTCTFRSPTGSHITLLAKCRGTNDSGKWVATELADAKLIFIEVPNDGGWNDKVARYSDGKGLVPERNADPARVWCAKQLLAYVQGQPTAEGLEIMEEERCGRCGRQLTDPVSIERGIGPECYGKITGSTHETKTRPASTDARLGGTHRDGSTVVLKGQPVQDGGTGIKAELHDSLEQAEAAVSAAASAKPKRSSRPTRRERRPDEKPAAKTYHPTCDQQTTLPGTSFEDIFRARADHLGIELR